MVIMIMRVLRSFRCSSSFGCILFCMLISIVSFNKLLGPDAKSFLFSLKSKEWNTPVTMPSNGSGSIHRDGSLGPTFSDNGYYTSYTGDYPNVNQCTFKYFGHFPHPSSVPITSTLLAGAQNFLIKKLEVYAV